MYFLWPRLSAADGAWAQGLLNPQQQRLFLAMRRSDQAHVVRVARRLATLSPPPWVLEAALLHDCGKPGDFGLVSRCAGVLFDPLLRQDLQGPGWRWLEIYRHHDAWSLAAAEQAGTSAKAIELLRASQGNSIDAPAEVCAWLASLEVCDAQG